MVGIVIYSLVSEYIGPLMGFEVVKKEGYDTFKGLDYVFVVKCGVKNNGIFPGTATVTAIFEGEGRSEKQTQKVYLRRGDYKEVEFVFDVSFWRNLFNPSIFKYDCYTGI